MTTDSFYVQQLFERITLLKARLLANNANPSPLTQECDAIMDSMKQVLSLYGDRQVYALFEVTLIPRIERLMDDAREQMRLHQYAKKMTRRVETGTRREKLIALQKAGVPLPPPVNEYRPIPTPVYDEKTRALIEDALIMLKQYLTEIR